MKKDIIEKLATTTEEKWLYIPTTQQYEQESKFEQANNYLLINYNALWSGIVGTKGIIMKRKKYIREKNSPDADTQLISYIIDKY